MRKIFREEYPWFLAHAVWFWVVPLAANFLESADQTGFYLLMLMIGNPLFCMITAVLYGLRRGRKWSFLIYPFLGWIASMFMYYNDSAFAFGLIAMVCSIAGLIFGGWSYTRKLTEAEKWKQKEEIRALKEKQSAPEPPAETIASANRGPRVASKTAVKNQQKAAARKAKEKAEREAKLQAKNAPQQKKKKRGH